MASPQKTSPGLPLAFPATLYNDLVEMAKEWKLGKGLKTPGQSGLESSPTILPVRNNTGADRDRFSVAKIGNRLLTDDINQQNQKGVTAVAVDAADNDLAIWQIPVAAGDTAPAVVSGVSMALVNITNTGHRFATPSSGQPHLVSGSSGPYRVLYPATSTGIQAILVQRMPTPGFLIFQAPREGLPPADTTPFLGNQFGSAVCKVLNLSSTGVYTDSGTTQTIYNTSRFRAYLANTVHPTSLNPVGSLPDIMRIGIARNIGGLWIADPDDQLKNVYATGGSVFASNVSALPATGSNTVYPTTIRTNSFVRFDGSSVGGKVQDAAGTIAGSWTANFRFTFPDNNLGRAAGQVSGFARLRFGGTLVDQVNFDFYKPTHAAGSAFTISKQIAGHFFFAFADSQSMAPSFDFEYTATGVQFNVYRVEDPRFHAIIGDPGRTVYLSPVPPPSGPAPGGG